MVKQDNRIRDRKRGIFEFQEKAVDENKNYIYSKLFNFFSIDLTIYPIISGIIYFKDGLNPLFVLSFIAYFFGLIIKIDLITNRLRHFSTNFNQLWSEIIKIEYADKVAISEKINAINQEFYVSRMKGTIQAQRYQLRLITWLNDSIAFSMVGMLIALISILSNYSDKYIVLLWIFSLLLMFYAFIRIAKTISKYLLNLFYDLITIFNPSLWVTGHQDFFEQNK